MKCKWYHCPHDAVGRSSFCSSQCQNKYGTQKRRIKVKIMAVMYLGGKCQNPECGWVGPADGYDFHHKDPEKKDFAISRQGTTRSWAKIKSELDKCTLLCSRCHRVEHWKTKATRAVEEEVLHEMAQDPEAVRREINLVPNAQKPKPAPKPRSKINWPSDEDLHRMVWEKPRTKLAKELGVSNVAIGKRCRTRGIDQPPRGYWSKSGGPTRY